MNNEQPQDEAAVRLSRIEFEVDYYLLGYQTGNVDGSDLDQCNLLTGMADGLREHGDEQGEAAVRALTRIIEYSDNPQLVASNLKWLADTVLVALGETGKQPGS